MTDAITPFALAVTDAELADLKSRLRQTRWARADPVEDWSRGVPLPYIEQLAAYWPTASTGGSRKRGSIACRSSPAWSTARPFISSM